MKITVEYSDSPSSRRCDERNFRSCNGSPVMDSEFDSHCVVDSSVSVDLPSTSDDAVLSAGFSEDVSLSDWLFQKYKKSVEVGAGLANLGNTCFLNSVLQCLAHSFPLLNRIFSFRHGPHSNSANSEFCILCELKELVEHSLASKGGVIRPKKFFNNLNYFSSYFQMYQQEDAHEFLQCFLEKLETFFHSSLQDSSCSQCENLVKQVFGGSIVSKLKCCSCGHSSDSCEASVDLSLEIEDADSLEMALQSFTGLETDIKFTCDKCQEEVCFEKQLCLNKTPLVAVFHLKRFRNDGYFGEKIDKHVTFPTNLDLQPYTSSGRWRNNNEKLMYDLYAILVHSGTSSTSGHYFCFVRVSPNIWCKFDDEMVELVDENTVLSQEAYVLFYTKEGTPWFSSFVEDLKMVPDHERCHTSPTSVLDNKSIVSSSSDNESVFPDRNDAVIDGQGNEEKEKTDGVPSISVATPLASESIKEVSPNPETKIEPDYIFKAGLGMPPSPEIYRDDDDPPPDAMLSFVSDGLRSAKLHSCKRQLETEMDDLERKQAMVFIKHCISGSRRQQLMSALKISENFASTTHKAKGTMMKKNRRKRKNLRAPFHGVPGIRK